MQMTGLIENAIFKSVSNSFTQCSIVVVHNALHTSFQEKLAKLIILLALELSHDIYLFNLTRLYYPEICSKPLGCIHQHRSCVLSIILLAEVNENMLQAIQNLLIPRNFEISKKDEDFYLIHTEKKENVPLVLKSYNFGMALKYKLLLIEGANNSVEYFTVCFYCNPGQSGKEAVVPLKLSFEYSVVELFPDFVRTFNGHQMRVSVSTGTHQLVQIRPSPGAAGEYEKMRGSYFYILDELAKVFNFTYSVKAATGGGTGLILPNGTWVGATGDVLNEVADMGMVSAVTYQRYRHVSFCYAFSWEWLTYATAIAKTKISWEALIWPFSTKLWLFLIVCMLLVLISVSILHNFGNIFTEARLQSIWNLAEVVYGTLLEQNFYLPGATPLRILWASWFIYAIVLGTGYKSKLVTALGFPILEHLPQSFRELALSGYSVGLCYVGGAAYSVFNSSTNPTYVKLANSMQLFYDITDCFVCTLNDNSACIGYDSMANYVLAKNLTDRKGRKRIVVSKASTFFVACGMAVTKRAIFRTNFDKYLSQWDSMAILSRFKSLDFESVRKSRFNWEQSKNILSIDAKEPSEYQQLTIGSLVAIFVFPAFGLIIGTQVLVLEVCRIRYYELIYATNEIPPKKN